MSNFTRQEIIDAHEALTDLRDSALEWAGIKAEEQYRAVLKTLPPKPQPTMAEVEWDDDKHFLAEAEQSKYGQVIMLALDGTGFIEFLIPRLGEYRYGAVCPDTLTPTGKRYTLTEIEND